MPACVTTLFEEARTELLFRDGDAELGGGVVVARLSVHYRAPLVYSGTPVVPQLVPYDLDAGRPRRITPAQRAFLGGYRDAEGSTGDA